MIGALRDSALLDSILAAAVDGMIVSDKDGTILRSNDAATKLFQHELAELVGQNVRILMPTNMADYHNGYIAHHIETGQRALLGSGETSRGCGKMGPYFHCTYRSVTPK